MWCTCTWGRMVVSKLPSKHRSSDRRGMGNSVRAMPATKFSVVGLEQDDWMRLDEPLMLAKLELAEREKVGVGGLEDSR
jgi:hypothetical protein